MWWSPRQYRGPWTAGGRGRWGPVPVRSPGVGAGVHAVSRAREGLEDGRVDGGIGYRLRGGRMGEQRVRRGPVVEEAGAVVGDAADERGAVAGRQEAAGGGVPQALAYVLDAVGGGRRGVSVGVDRLVEVAERRQRNWGRCNLRKDQ